MKSLLLIACLALAGCATNSFADYAKAANELDPGCSKKVHVEVRPLLVFGFPVPLVSGTLDKDCGPTQ
jgi:hypothetical protein